MYEAHWGLKESPFALTPDPRFLFMSRSHEDALMMLVYAVERNKGAAMLSGSIGLGKTTVTHKLLESLDAVRYRTVCVVNPKLTPTQLLAEILDQLGVEVRRRNRQEMLAQLRSHLEAEYARGRRVVLLIDEAHLIPDANALEDLRLLLNLQMDDRFLLSVILIGQPELREKVAEVPALEQRIGVRHVLQPLDVLGCGQMLLHRMRVAGYMCERSPFTPDAVHTIHKAAEGAPRMALHLADAALLMGMARDADAIDGFLAHQVVEQFFGRAA